MVGIIANLLFGCRHKRITRPITPVHKAGEAAGITYVACLDCGKQLHYDLEAMRIGKPIAKPKNSPVVNSFQTGA